jgi:hypothetical protein
LKKETLTTEEAEIFLNGFLKVVSEPLIKQLGKKEGDTLGQLVMLTMGDMFKIFEREEMDHKLMGTVAQSLVNLVGITFKMSELRSDL